MGFGHARHVAGRARRRVSDRDRFRGRGGPALFPAAGRLRSEPHMSEPTALDLGPEDLHVGLSAELVREVSAADVLEFARLSGDRNPLHTDPAYAASTNYGRPIVHGAFQVSLAS